MALHQLGTAMELFIRDRDPVAVQCLAWGGAELIEKIATMRQYWNAFKHMTTHKGELRDDSETLAAFNDTKNDAALFVGWWDYQKVTGRLPLPVQVFQIWWYALNERALAPEADIAEIQKVFPNIMAAERTEQKRRLRRTIEKYRSDKAVLSDPRTEVARRFVFRHDKSLK